MTLFKLTCYSSKTLHLRDAVSHALTTPLHISSYAKEEISPRMCQEAGLLSGPERSQFSSWRAIEPGLPGRGIRKRVDS